MTLDAYKQLCADTIGSAPANDWPGAKFLTALMLHNLYNIAAEGTEEEANACFDHWWTLPMSEELKRETLDKIRASESWE